MDIIEMLKRDTIIEMLKRDIGVDLNELMREYMDIALNCVTDEHFKAVDACALAMGLAASQGDGVMLVATAKLLFAIGYKVGRDAPDLSVFEERA